MKKVPMRTCVVTHEKLPKKELLRIVKYENTITVDPSGKLNGKGCYIKKDSSVLEKLKKDKTLNKVFEMDIDESIYDEIEKTLN